MQTMTQEKLNPYAAPGINRYNNLEDVIAREFCIDRKYLDRPFVKNRKREIVNARFFYMSYIAYTLKKGPNITSSYLGVTHATVIHAGKEVANRIKTEYPYRMASINILKEVEAKKVKLPFEKQKLIPGTFPSRDFNPFNQILRDGKVIS